MKEEKTILIELPVGYIEEEGYHIIFNTPETDMYLNIPIVVQGDTKEDVIKSYWKTVNCYLEFEESIRRRHDRWALFYSGRWKGIGTCWFSVLGFHFYFRYGKKMKGGFYFPFTKLNLTVNNYWRKKYKMNRTPNDAVSDTTKGQ